MKAVEPIYANLNPDLTKRVKHVDEESLVWRVAGECLRKINDAGGVCCDKKGAERVVKAMMKLLDMHTGA